MIRFQHVSKRYGDNATALNDLNFELDSGEMAFITGHSGAGKSTLLKLIALIERPSHGQIMLHGRSLRKISRQQVASHRRRIGVVFQDHQLLSDRNVFDNVALPLVVAGMSPREITRRVHAVLDKVGLLNRVKSSPLTMSGGEQQRVGIARALVNKPDVLLADEPTGNLDPDLSREIMRLFLEFNQVGTSVLIASHDLELISRLGKRVLTLEQGQLIQDLPAIDVEAL